MVDSSEIHTPFMIFLQRIQNFIECESDKSHVFSEILSGAHVILLDNGIVYDVMKKHGKKRISSHYNNHLSGTEDDIQYEIVGKIPGYNECNQTIGTPQNSYNVLYGCIRKAEHGSVWIKSDRINENRMTWFQFENSSFHENTLKHTIDTLYYLAKFTRYNVGPCRTLSTHTDSRPIVLSNRKCWTAEKKIQRLSLH